MTTEDLDKLSCNFFVGFVKANEMVYVPSGCCVADRSLDNCEGYGLRVPVLTRDDDAGASIGLASVGG